MTRYFAVLGALCGLLSLMTTISLADEGGKVDSGQENRMLQDMPGVDKRYVAALAKNGRLPKFSFGQKKMDQDYSSSLDEPNSQMDLNAEVPGDLFLEEKRHVGAFLKSRGKPSFTKMTGDGDFVRYDRSTLMESGESAEHPGRVDYDETAVKRNVASLARLGRLNAIRYANFQPHYVSGKRLNYDELSDGMSKNDEDNLLDVGSDFDCEDDDDGDLEETKSSEDGASRPNWIQKKRYVAALARSGRLPIWHSQRMWWGGKRDTPIAYWLRARTGARGGKRENVLLEPGFTKSKNNRCKKLFKGDYPLEKRNLAMLAKNGKLPHRS